MAVEEIRTSTVFLFFFFILSLEDISGGLIWDCSFHSKSSKNPTSGSFVVAKQNSVPMRKSIKMFYRMLFVVSPLFHTFSLFLVDTLL